MWRSLGVWAPQRLCALLVDIGVYVVPYMAFRYVLTRLGHLEAGMPTSDLAADLELVGWMVSAALAVLNRVVLDAYGRSLGRLLTRTRLVSTRTGQPLGVSLLLVRLFLHLLDACTVGMLGRYTSPGRWHAYADRTLGTAVVVTRPGRSPA